jgi:hypothetical protein
MIGIAALAVLTACAHFGERELPSPTPRAAEINTAMDAALIPQIDLRRVPAGAAVQAWSEANRTAHPQPFTVKYFIVRPTTFTAGTATPAPALKKEPMVTVRRKNVTSKKLLNEICRQADWVWMVRGKTIVIGPRGSFPNAQP